MEDAGRYTCQCDDKQTSAYLNIEGQCLCAVPSVFYSLLTSAYTFSIFAMVIISCGINKLNLCKFGEFYHSPKN